MVVCHGVALFLLEHGMIHNMLSLFNSLSLGSDFTITNRQCFRLQRMYDTKSVVCDKDGILEASISLAAADRLCPRHLCGWASNMRM